MELQNGRKIMKGAVSIRNTATFENSAYKNAVRNVRKSNPKTEVIIGIPVIHTSSLTKYKGQTNGISNNKLIKNVIVR